MSLLKKTLFYGGMTIGIPFIWHKLGLYDLRTVRKKSYSAGLKTSQMFKKYPMWDKYGEPFLIKQFSIIFASSNSFIQGMISDNENYDVVIKKVEEMRDDIKEELEIYKKNDSSK